MKFNISNPATGAQKVLEIEDERKLRNVYDKRIAAEVDGESIGEDFKGYVFRISGGNDKQGFPMVQGILSSGRVRLLLSKGSKAYRPRRTGERKRRSVRGCIVGSDLSVLNMVVVKKGEKEIPGLTDTECPRRLAPKRANKIRKLFNLAKNDDVRKFVVRRELKPKDGKKYTPSKAPKIQRLVTPVVRQRKRALKALKKTRGEKSQVEKAEYEKLLAIRMKEAKDKRKEQSSKRAEQDSKKKEAPAAKPAAKAAAKPAAKGKK